jgi:hypothetical protein
MATKPQKVLELIHLDAWELIRTTTLGGAKYFITFIVNHFRFTTIFFVTT